MNFFQAQEHARKQTKWLVIFFAMAVISLLALTNVLVMYFLANFTGQDAAASQASFVFEWRVFFTVSAVVLTVILFASLYKFSNLKVGGKAVAEMFDAELITHDGDFDQQKVLNVVEEMAIASGTPVPPVYLLNEAGINAFAAGYSPADAVIGVTRGCISQLDRSELQGVIAHEFSHILNGDMRINIRLMAILFGITSIGFIGYVLLNSGTGHRRGYSHRSNSDKSSGGIMALGVGLLVIGYAGTFFGNIIKAAVSRQREYLADASAVQFTRSNLGIANALKQIGSRDTGSVIENPAGAEISHSLFAEGVSNFFSSIFATHPPLEKRIRMLDPSWNGIFYVEHEEKSQAEINQQEKVKSKTEKTANEKLMGGLAGAGIILSKVGRPDNETLMRAQALLQNIPSDLRTEIQQPYGARAVIYLLLLDENSEICQSQLAYLKEASDDGVYDVLQKLKQSSSHVKAEHRLPLIDMSLPALRLLSAQQYERFKNNILKLIDFDKKVSLFEWSLQKIILNNLDANFVNAVPPKARFNSFKGLEKECSILLSVLIYVGKKKKIDKLAVMKEAGKVLATAEVVLLPITDVALPRLNKSLDTLKQLKSLQKPALLKACIVCICSDQNLSATEAELFRAIANTLDCPMPPINI